VVPTAQAIRQNMVCAACTGRDCTSTYIVFFVENASTSQPLFLETNDGLGCIRYPPNSRNTGVLIIHHYPQMVSGWNEWMCELDKELERHILPT
jgi:hypothetical protein